MQGLKDAKGNQASSEPQEWTVAIHKNLDKSQMYFDNSYHTQKTTHCMAPFIWHFGKVNLYGR